MTAGLIPRSWKHWKAYIKSSFDLPGRKQNLIENVMPELVIPI
jgi:hypothetical protein